MYLAYTSFAVRMLQGRDILKSTAAALDADAFLELCRRFDVGGAQIDLSQLPVDDPEALAAVRSAFEGQRIAIELSVPSRYLESPEAFAQAVAVAQALGATRARWRCSMAAATRASRRAAGGTRSWRSGAARCCACGRSSIAILSRSAIENHKDWLATELVALLRAIDSPHVGRLRRLRQQPRAARGSRRDDRRCSRPSR